MKISVLGLGHIGLPTAAMFAHAGFEVSGYDTDPAVRQAIRKGTAGAADAQVRTLLSQALAVRRLQISDSLQSADAYVICVPTPTQERKPDLRYVVQSAKAIAPLLKSGDIVVLESTVPPGTTERTIADTIHNAGHDPDTIHIAHAPERVIPGAIVTELKHNARIIGGRRPGDAEAASQLYAPFVEAKIHLTDCRTAELVKVIENTYRDVNIAYANELALLAEELGVDAWEAIALANNHPRVNIMSPGPGVGGHCIPVDPHFLSNANPFVTELIQTARRINERMPHIVVRRIEQLVGVTRRGAKIALLGASYKANVGDTRESPAAVVCDLLEERRYCVAVYDPVATRFQQPLVSLAAAAEDASALVLLTDHDAFRSIVPDEIGRRMRSRIIFDCRNFIDPETWRAAAFQVHALGRMPREEFADVSAA